MRLKYYLRGIGIGIIFATLLLTISFYFGRDALGKRELTDEEIIARAEELGMVMSEADTSSEEELDASQEEAADTATDIDSSDVEFQDDTTQADDSTTAEATATDAPASDTEAEEDDESEDTTVTYVPFTVRGGESSDTVAYNLYKQGLVDSSDKFNKYMNSLGVDNRIQAGTFYVKQGSSYDDLIALLVNKDTRTTTPPQ